jgi:hypothetical protein
MEGPPVMVDLPAPAPTPGFEGAPSVYVLNARLDEATLRSLEDSLRETGAQVVFEDAATELPVDRSPVTTPAAVIWWGHGPSGWASWGQVPVVIQR